MTEKEKRKQVTKISVFITSIFVIFLSISYAFINQTLVGTKKQVITAGNLQLNLTEGDSVTLENALPMYDEVGMMQKAFEFQLSNNSIEKIKYNIKIIDITEQPENKLDNTLIKLGLEKENKTTIKQLSTITDSILDKGIINGNETIHYRLRLWIDSSVEDERLIRQKTSSYRIDVTAEQNKVVGEPTGTLRKIGYEFDEVYGPRCRDEFCERKGKIISVIFEDKIDIPSTVGDAEKMDMSEEQNGSVIAYLEEIGTDTDTYKMHIQGENGVYANPDSSFLFSEFQNLETIDGLEYFNTSKVTNMSFMFFKCSSLELLDLNNFDTSNVGDMSYMLFGHKGNILLDSDGFDTSKVTNMSYMFSNYTGNDSLDLSGFDTSNVTNMSYMFDSYSGGNLTLGDWNVSGVNNMYNMFYRYSGGILTIGNWDISGEADLSSMFFGYSSAQPLNLSKLNTSNVTNMPSMFRFYRSPQPLDLSNFDTSNVTEMPFMFEDWASEASLDISNFDFSKVTDKRELFGRSSKYYASPIFVKDEAMKAWVLEQNPNLTGVTIKGA